MAEYAYEYIDKRMTQEARKLGLKKSDNLFSEGIR